MTTLEHIDKLLREPGAWFQAWDDEGSIRVLLYRSKDLYGHGTGESFEEACVHLLSNLGRLSGGT